MSAHRQQTLANGKPTLAGTLAGLTLTLILALATTQYAHAQSFQLLHTFTEEWDGGFPVPGVIIGQDESLYGTTINGGYIGGTCAENQGCGVVYKMTPTKSGWTFTTLYTFHGGNDGSYPGGRVIFGPDGNLYGATAQGGGEGCGAAGCGTVFRLSPPPPGCNGPCFWTETVLYRFSEGGDGVGPQGDIAVDHAGNVYGTTAGGGLDFPNCFGACGVVYQIAPVNRGWVENVLYQFRGGDDGFYPQGGITLGQDGNLYGTASSGGAYHAGTVFELTPTADGWQKTTIHSFNEPFDGGYPAAGLTSDASGNLYGTAEFGGVGGVGTVFQLTPSNGEWNFNVIYAFSGEAEPYTDVFITASGNVYGSTWLGGWDNCGTVFQLTPGSGGWSYKSIHQFQCYTEGNDVSAVVLDQSGNIYGTDLPGSNGGFWGHVFEITP